VKSSVDSAELIRQDREERTDQVLRAVGALPDSGDDQR
jgi:hypothetical protein